MEDKFLLFGFDMETDIGSTSTNYEGVKCGTKDIIDVLNKNRVKSTFLFTGDCASNNEDIVRAIDDNGFEIGCHSLFHEDLGEVNFASSSISRILDDELEERLKINVEIVQNIIKKEPVSFRAPRGFGSNKLIQVLQKLGFKLDSSYLQFNRSGQDFPYFASENNWEEEGRSDVLELPCFAFDIENAEGNTFARRLDQWPRLRTHGADFVFKNMQPIVGKQIKNHGFSVLTFYLHPWEFYPMPKSIKYAEGTLNYDEFLYKNTGKKQTEELDNFINLTLNDGFTIVDFKQFREIFENRT